MFTFLKRWEQAGTEEVYDQNEAARKGRWNELGVDRGGRETTRLWTQRMTQKKKKTFKSGRTKTHRCDLFGEWRQSWGRRARQTNK